MNYRKRQISLKNSLQKSGDFTANQSIEIPHNILPELLITDIDPPRNQYISVNINNYGTITNDPTFNYALTYPQIEPINEEKNAPLVTKKYHQIYSSALYEMKEFAKK